MRKRGEDSRLLEIQSTTIRICSRGLIPWSYHLTSPILAFATCKKKEKEC